MNLPTVLGERYLLGGSLGSGGMAQVVRARDQLLDRDVAVKLFGPGFDPNGAARASGEMRTLAGLSHPNLVVVHDAGTDNASVPPRAFLVMQLIDGPSLADLLKSGPLPELQVRQIGAGIAHALAYIHEQGVVHRDIKPGNILLDRNGRPYLADFGVAQTLGESALTATGLTVGTAAFLSPEQVRGIGVGPASDTYALGLVLIEALTGEREYAGTTAETALARLSRPPVVVGRVPPAWQALLTAMTATEPADRLTAAEAAGLLDDLAGMSADAVESPATVALPRQDVGSVVRTTVLSAEASTQALATAPDPTRAMPVPTGPPRVLPRPAGRHPRRPRPTILAGTATVLVGLVALVVALTAGSGATESPVTPAPSGAPGPARLGPDLERLKQLVQP